MLLASNTPSGASRPTTSTRPPLLDQVRVDFEPVPVFGRLIAIVCDELMKKGIALELGKFEELPIVNMTNRDNWLPLFPTFDVANGLMTQDSAFWLCGRAKGDVVCSWACRLFDWRDTCFADEAESLRLKYADPSVAIASGDRVTATIASAKALTGSIAFEGAGWVRPDFRRQGVIHQLATAARSIAASRWKLDHAASVMTGDLLARGLAERVGYKHIEEGIEAHSPQNGNDRSALLWMSREELVEILQQDLRRRTTQIDP